MFKEKRNKGFISVLMLSLVVFAIASISGFLGQMHKKPTERFADTTDTGKEVTMSVYGIYPNLSVKLMVELLFILCNIARKVKESLL